MQPSETKHRFWYQKPVIWITVGVLACLGFLAMPHVQGTYHRWTGVRKVRRATEALARNDYETAIINARGALATNAKDLEALRVMARTAEAAGSPQALDFRRQIEVINPSDAENLIGLAEASLRAGNVNAAEQALKNVPSPNQATTRYHDVAAGIAWAQKDAADFESHTEEASKLAPADASYQLKLATLRLTAKSPELRAGALATLDQLKAKPATCAAALRALLRDAMDRGERDRAIEFANALASAPAASLGDKLSRLSAWQTLLASQWQSPFTASRVSEKDFYLRLSELQKEMAAQPELLAQVVTWMNAHHMALQIPEWVETLPAEIVSKPPVCAAVAESYALASNWTKLKATIENASWEKLEYLRFAFLSRAYERLGHPGSASTAWNRALETAQANPGSLQRLIAEIGGWSWEEKTEQALWKLADQGRCPRWAAEALWDIAFRKGDTPDLYKASTLLLQADPKSISARNNFIRLALITQQDEAAAHPLAEALYKENRADAAIASTYALSLFRQNRPEDAAGVLAQLPPEQLQKPWLAFYQGLFLSAAGRPDEAEKYLQLAANEPLYPEMESIRRILSSAFEAKQFDRDGKREECGVAWNAATAAAGARPDCLELLAKVAIKWSWEDKAGEALTKLAANGRCPAWAIDTLWSASLKSGNSAAIYNAGKLILAANPKNFLARNAFITVALLAGKEADSPHQLAEALYEENRDNADAATTYSLSLYRQGKLEQARAVLRTLKPEQLHEPRPALYHGIVLAAMGEADEAAQSLQIGAGAPLLPDEKTIVEILQSASQWRALDREGDRQAAQDAWIKAVAAAEQRTDMLETLGRLALKWDAADKAAEVFWKRAGSPACPRWVIDHLWANAEKKRDSAQLYKLSRLLRRADPGSVTIQNNFVWLSLLTGQDADFPHRQADAMRDENPGNADVAATCALSLYQRNKPKEALALLAALTPEQQRTPRVAYYYGICLTADGQTAKAQEYLRIGRAEPLLPEEETLLAKVNSTTVLNAVP